MIWVGSFKPLQSALAKLEFTNAPLEVDTWVRSDIGLISPLVDWLMSLIALSRCVLGDEQFVELALREALSNAMLHGQSIGRRQVGSHPLLLRMRPRSVHRRQRSRTWIRPPQCS
jgi:hypothetical protein